MPPPATVRTSTAWAVAVAVALTLVLALRECVPETLGVGAAVPGVGDT